MTLTSPAITQHIGVASSIAREYTCHGADRSPPLKWGAVPSGTHELALFVMNTTPVAGQLFFDWALAGLNPNLKELQAGQAPADAVTGKNSFGHATYELCPPGAKQESYIFMLYALPTSLSPKPNFNPLALREQALHTARHTGLLVGSYG